MGSSRAADRPPFVVLAADVDGLARPRRPTSHAALAELDGKSGAAAAQRSRPGEFGRGGRRLRHASQPERAPVPGVEQRRCRGPAVLRLHIAESGNRTRDSAFPQGRETGRDSEVGMRACSRGEAPGTRASPVIPGPPPRPPLASDCLRSAFARSISHALSRSPRTRRACGR